MYRQASAADVRGGIVAPADFPAIHPRQSPRAFTLIELLIYVAIIAILALVALPNFLEAQTRSKISRVRADHRTMATALEAYFVDINTYPANGTGAPNLGLIMLTTPIAFVSGGGYYRLRPDNIRNFQSDANPQIFP